MEFIFLLLIVLALWWLSTSASSTDRRISQGEHRTPQRSSGSSSSLLKESKQSTYGPSNSRQSNVLRKPKGDCICGCNGVPLTLLPEYSIDYEKYKVCPARKKRKLRGVYIDDAGQLAHWIPRGQQRKAVSRTRRDAEKKQREESRKQKKLAAQLEQDHQRQVREEQEKLRHLNGAPAQSASEALRRGLETYIGKECGVGHGGERHSRNGECVECRRIDQRKRDAMRRGAFPRDLTPQERKEIGEIYAEARRLTKQTGIEHHVDHIKPLASGWEHHPRNLRVITADENLKKGSSWDGRSHLREDRRAPADLQGEPPRGTYRNLGVGRKDDIP